MLDQPTDAGLLRAFTHMSLTCDPRTPVDVPDDILRTLPPDSEIARLELQRAELYSEIKAKSCFTGISLRNVVGLGHATKGKRHSLPA